MPAKSAPSLDELFARMGKLQPKLLRRKLTIASAESCTGGLLGRGLTAHGGSSAVYQGGGGVYSNAAKTILVDVPPQLIASHGAVSSVVAGALARGARVRLGAKIGLGISGIAGPGGATPGKPVGLVLVAIDSDKHSTVRKNTWSFHRTRNRLAAVGVALDLVEELVA